MKKQRLRLWQFVMLLIPLVALPVIMCFPFYSLNKNVAKDTMQDVVQSIKEDLQDSSSEYKDQLLDSFDENLSTMLSRTKKISSQSSISFITLRMK